MSATQGAIYALVKWLIDNTLSSHVGQIAVPFVIILLLLRFFVWTKATAKGERMDSMQAEMESLRSDREDAIVQYQTIRSSGYRELRDQGFSTREIAILRRQRAGRALPSREAQQRNRRLRIK
ncbi:hypothetical protein K2Z83_04635 [Oscillochloris sp. ZM17-4]|uniref:hypothetical protein n=1 Tax=Oscillochloris sp. ZM17-4 TaxID=2866714 RepID=UPI001C733F3E|nr:hypothetical protein [Oscillochloris sp. ZM17-4]MBX0326968.1 hypothetical protein [Oscillochloris sp. ZM17-4]